MRAASCSSTSLAPAARHPGPVYLVVDGLLSTAAARRSAPPPRLAAAGVLSYSAEPNPDSGSEPTSSMTASPAPASPTPLTSKPRPSQHSIAKTPHTIHGTFANPQLAYTNTRRIHLRTITLVTADTLLVELLPDKSR